VLDVVARLEAYQFQEISPTIPPPHDGWVAAKLDVRVRDRITRVM